MIIEIEALDTLFFRDGKPFTMGDDTWANAMFPPMPSVIYGAIRSAYLGQYDVALDEVDELTKNLRIKNIWFRIATQDRQSNRKTYKKYFIQPLDLVHKTDVTRIQKRNIEKYGSYDVYQTELKNLNSSSNLKTQNIENILTLDEKIEGGTNNLFTETDFENYLKGKTTFEAIKLDQQISSEPKIGIGRNNNTFTVQEGLLYRIGLLRMEDFKILVEFDGLALNSSGVIKLGGEGKLAYYKSLDEELHKIDFSITTMNIDEVDLFKVCLATPAIYSNGYCPSDEYFTQIGVEVELVTCTLGKSINIGGFDMKTRTPKEMYKAVPAGSTYYYKLKKGSLKALEEKIETHSFSEIRGNEGFGIAYIAKA